MSALPRTRLRAHLPALAPGAMCVALMLVWAVHNGGYDADTWYWGALLLLATLASVLRARGRASLSLSRPTIVALGAFGLYVGWSYLSVAWAGSPGDALQGSNRALLYLMLFALLAVLPWTAEGALATLVIFVIGVGVIAFVLLARLASADHVGGLVIGGRLSAPTGYFNATAALFTLNALSATVLATRRELPALLRAVLLAVACAGLQLALIVQSRGWLFTLPLIALVVITVVPGRLRVVAASVIPVIAALIPLRRLLDVYDSSSAAALDHAAARAGQAALLICAAMLIVGAMIAWGDKRLGPVAMGKTARRGLGAGLAALALSAMSVGGVVATHGHPLRFIDKQLSGAVHQQVNFSSGSHFADVGSGRYDFWRVAWEGFLANPIGGLGQDNFADYYVTHRQTAEEPSWTHSLEMRLLVHTGIVGFALFGAFLAAAIAAALRVRRRSDGSDAGSSALARAVAGAALIPLTVWLIHGSVDWFWEMPALSGPALGFLAIAGAVRRPAAREVVANPRARRIPRVLLVPAGAAALVAAVMAIGLPYLSVRDASIASNLRASQPAAALRALAAAARINPLSAEPARLAGTIALQTGRYREAEQRFGQAITREPGGWFAWLGAGLAASALGNSSGAQHDFLLAASINRSQPAVSDALARVLTARPLRAAQALRQLVLAH